MRYSALVTGIFYGALHRRTLQAKYETSSAAAEVKKREHWLADAKKAWAQKQANNNGRESAVYPFVGLVRQKAARVRADPLAFPSPSHSLVPAAPPSHPTDTVITDPDAPGFDLEALLKSLE